MHNPFASKLFKYPGIIYPCFELEKDKKDFVEKIKSEERSIFIEYGSGSGNHLLQLADRNEKSLCVGFEIRFKRAVRTIEKGQDRGINNVIIFRSKGEAIPELFPLAGVKGLFINFPDPWEKKRWLKHRVLTYSVVSSFFPIIAPGGFISIKTDHEEYYQTFMNELRTGIVSDSQFYIEKETSSLPKISEITEPDVKAGFEENYADIESEFEKLFRGQKKNIGYCLIRKEG